MTDPKSNELNATQQLELSRARRAARWVGLYVPLALLAIATAIVIVWLPRMPNPAATHWGLSGGPDRFGSPWTYVWLTAGLGFGLVLLMWIMVVRGSRGQSIPVWSGFQRFLAAFTAGLAVFLAAVNLGSVAIQLDLDDVASVGGVGGVVALAFVAAIAVTAVAWFAQPRVEVQAQSANPSLPLELSDTERVVWIGAVRPSKVFLGVMGSAIGLLVASTVLTFVVAGGRGSRWVMVGTLALVLGLALVSLWFRVRIDAGGLEARSLLGWPKFRLPAADVASAEATTITPLTEFGGCGLRWGPGRFGIVMRKGEGIVATRVDGKIFAVTLDDAETAAAVLAAAAKRAQAGSEK